METASTVVAVVLCWCLVAVGHTTAVNSTVYLGSPFMQEALRRAKELTDAAYARTYERLKVWLAEGSVRPSDLLGQFKRAGPGTKAHIRAAELLDNTVELIREMVYTHTHTSTLQTNLTELLSVEDMDTLLQATGCVSHTQTPVCETDCLSQRYRTISGECNNRQHPLWGAANTPYTRWLPPEYGDPRGAPRGRDPLHPHHNHSLPSVRLVSQQVLSTQNENISLDWTHSHLLVEWGQWIDHDLVLTPQSASSTTFRTGADCSRSCSTDTPCFPIQIPLSDPRHGVQTCMPFFRSAPSCPDGSLPYRPREQLNAITSFVDASMVYGSSDWLARALRNLSSPLGLLAQNRQHQDGGLAYMPYLPRTPPRPDPCGPRGPHNASTHTRAATHPLGNMTSCFQAGDSRANEHLGMIALHTLFLREHNRLAKELHQLNPHWSPDTLYQEARKILGAVHQVVTWDHYLPRVLGERAHAELMPAYGGYVAEADPSVANVFSTAAFRFAHVTINPVVDRLGPGYRSDPQHPALPLHHSLFASWRITQEGGIDPVLRGMLVAPAKLQTGGQMMVEELTERLFQAQGGLPFDLGSLNLQRGRDHGLPGYSAWRGVCGLPVPHNESDLGRVLGDEALARKLLDLYGTPLNVDVWLGAIAEPAAAGGRVGPLLACLLARQFRLLRDGDRLWWQRKGVFSSEQQEALSSVSLSRIICDNTHIRLVPSDPFTHTHTHRTDELLPCTHTRIPRLNLSAWKEPESDPRCGSVPRLALGFSMLCDSAVLYQCPSGYQLHGATHSKCDSSTHQWTPKPPICKDVDECMRKPPVCPSSMQCHNTAGSFTCTDPGPAPLSVSSVVGAVMAVVGGVALMFLIMAGYRRCVAIKPDARARACCQRRS